MELTTARWYAPAPRSSPLTPARKAAFVLAGVLAMGATTQALFWHTGFGLNFFLWTMLSVGGCLASLSTGRLTRVSAGVIVALVLLAFSVVRFAGEWTTTIAVPSSLLLLFVLPLALRDQARLEDSALLPLRALGALSGLPGAIRDASQVPSVALGGRSTPLLRVLKGLAIGFPLTCVFVGLLSTDIDFGHLLGRIQAKLGEALSFAVWTAITAASALVLHALYTRKAPLASKMEPYEAAYRSLVNDFFPGPSTEIAPVGRVAVSTWLMVVGQVGVVFLLFVAANLKNLFGGSAIVRAAGSMTYAKYLHAGVGQLLFATMLSICVVAVGHRLLRPVGASDVTVPGGTWLKAAECALLGLTAVTVLSCAERLAIYEDAYGATRQRLGVAFVVIAVFGALALTVVKVFRRSWGSYGGALASFFVGLAVTASLVNADAYVAGTNLDRASRGKPLDADYLATLSVDARSVLSHPFLEGDKALEARLVATYCAGRPSTDWRTFRGIGSCTR